VNHQQGFIVGICGSGRPVEAACDHCFVIDHGELVVQFVATSETGCANALLLQWF